MGLFWRIILAISLFAVVVLVSYIKSDLSAARIDTNPVAVQENQSADSVLDSGAVTDSEPGTRVVAVDSIAEESSDLATANDEDSATDKLPALEKQPEVKAPVPAPTQAKKIDPPKPAPVDSAKLVVDYFQKRMASLPDDLTSYERRVAIKELRDETCDKFDITPVQFNDFAREKNLAYP